jgi:hypothetical protein
VTFRRRQSEPVQEPEYVHPPKPPGVPEWAWPRPSGPRIRTVDETTVKRKFLDSKEHFVALESFTVGLHYYEKDKWVRRDYPGAAEIAKKHPEFLVPADGSSE